MSDEAHRTEAEEARAARIANGIRAVREGHGANCSSIGSVIDTIFATAVIGGAVLAAVAAAIAREDVRVVGNEGESPAPEPEPRPRPDEEGPR